MELIKNGFEEHVYIASSLIHMYAKCCLVSKAWEVFEKMRVQKVMLCNTLFARCDGHLNKVFRATRSLLEPCVLNWLYECSVYWNSF